MYYSRELEVYSLFPANCLGTFIYVLCRKGNSNDDVHKSAVVPPMRKCTDLKGKRALSGHFRPISVPRAGFIFIIFGGTLVGARG